MLVLALICLLVVIPQASSDCYFPDGTQDMDHEPCYYPGAGASGMCCMSGDSCLDSNMCRGIFGDDIYYYRGGCTVPNWENVDVALCPDFCRTGEMSNRTVQMVPCPGTVTEFWCNDFSRTANCTSGANILMFSAIPSVIATAGLPPGNSTGTAAPVLISATTGGTAKPEPSTTGSGQLAGGNSKATSTPVSALGNPPPPPPPTTTVAAPGGLPSASSSSSSSSATVTPLAVGVSLGGFFFAVAGLLAGLIIRRRLRNAPAKAESPPEEEVGAYPPHTYYEKVGGSLDDSGGGGSGSCGHGNDMMRSPAHSFDAIHPMGFPRHETPHDSFKIMYEAPNNYSRYELPG